MVPEFCTFQLRTRVMFGAGQLEDLADHLVDLPARRFLLVTDPTLAELGFVDRVERSVRGSVVTLAAVFDGVSPNSETAEVEEAARRGREQGCDGVLGLGGGSALDTAKAVAILLTDPEERSLLEFQGAQILPMMLPEPVRPVVAVPTTAGTGSEVTNVAVVLDSASTTKNAYMDDQLIPRLALLDPTLTTDLPPRITAATGMDALTHAIEAVVDLEHSPFSDGPALEAVALIDRYLERAVENGPDDPEARAGMLLASNLAGIAFSHSMVGVVHAVAHALGGLHRVPHGEANAVILPHGMRFNRDAAGGRLACVGRRFRGAPSGDREAAEHAIASVERLARRLKELCGLPTSLGDLGVPADGRDEVVEKALEDGAMLYNPTPVDEEAVEGILEAAS